MGFVQRPQQRKLSVSYSARACDDDCVGAFLMYRVTLQIGPRKEHRDFTYRAEALEIVNSMQDLFGERGFEFLVFDRQTGFYHYIETKTKTNALVGLHAISSAKAEGEPFIKTTKKTP